MAIAAPDSHFTLVEPMERRANWLSAAVTELGLENVSVVRARAEDVHRTDFDIATARAVAALDKLIRLLSPLIRGSSGKTVLSAQGLKGSRRRLLLQPSALSYSGSILLRYLLWV